MIVSLSVAPPGARAQDEGITNPIETWATAISEAMTPRWTGARVAPTLPTPRPTSTELRSRSWRRPLAVHADPEVPQETALAALAALERAHDWWQAQGWGESYPDGGRGGGSELDLYLRSSAPSLVPGTFDHTEAQPGERDDATPRPIRIGTDVEIDWAHLDAATSFAELDSTIPEDQLEACVISAYVQAIAAQQDPSEAPAWRRALGTFVAWQITGSLGCAEPALDHAQRHPEQGLVSHAPASGESGALLLAAISARHDEGTGTFVRDLWQGARQLTWDGDSFRAEPDMWDAIEHFSTVAQRPLARVFEDIGTARFFSGVRSGEGGYHVPLASELPVEVPLAGRARLDALPRSLARGEVELETGGTAYALVETPGAREGMQLRVWLRGEYPVQWSLTTIRLDADGRETSRVRVPPRREPRGYIPVELDGSTAAVVIVVTNVGSHEGAPDADEPDEKVRGFRLIVDRAE